MATLYELREWEDYLVVAFCIIGLIVLTKHILKFTKWVWLMFIRPPKNLTNYGSWALVTGCANGIGKALTLELASKGLNLILLDKDVHKLQATSNEIWQKYGKEKTKIKLIVMDLAKISGEEIEVKIKQEIEGLDVGVLVNNVGLCNAARFFHEFDLEGMMNLVNVNMNSATWITRAVLPSMLMKKRGVIVNIGSGSTVAVPSYPLYAVYAATKGYVAMFSRSLSVEYKQYGIDIQCQIPLLVATKLASIKKASFFIPSPEQYSKASIRYIGYDIVCVPYWTHAVLWCILNAMPESLVDWVLYRYFLSLRKKVIQKELKQKQ